MGIHSVISNRNISRQNRRKVKKFDKRIRKAKNQMVGEVADADLTTIHHLRKRRTSPRANITLSGKKRRKLLKQLKHMEAEKNKMEVATTTETTQKKQKKIRPNEIEMSDAQVPTTETVAKDTTDDVKMDE
ncbi:hypothetical protein NP493_543g00001 [Ridgeia piscesae]|uniref:Uncharacterized protein n=1 Tax=Ridgeia piscesae TaxID=27915 RepID=A0AAD9KX05_RIDPI|nr:hypothetical protein NP493_543g00001 [Ridgeia piscesae]